MSQLDLREGVDNTEEVKEPEEVITESGDGEGAVGESSPPETNQDEESSDTEEKSEEEESVVTTDDATPEESEEDTAVSSVDVEALKSERERLLNDIKELRTERRKARTEEEEKPLLVDKPTDDELKDVAPEDVALIEKVLKSKGYVRKEEIHQQTYKSEVDRFKDAWLDEHPEYKPENDPDDKNWNSLNETIRSYFKAPAAPKDVVKILDLAHNMVNPKNPLPVKTTAKTDVAAKKIAVSSKGSTASGAKNPSDKRTQKIDVEYLKGFSDEEKAELLS